MATFSGEDLQQARFSRSDLRGARFVGCDLSGAVLRAVDVGGADIDAPWLLEADASLTINGVDVVGFVDTELNRRFPGREQRQAGDPDGLRSAWAALQRAWAAVLERVASMPDGTSDISVDGEWSFAQTLRHLVLATDMWFGRAIEKSEHPFHPLGLMDSDTAGDGWDLSVFSADQPTYAEVLQARAGRVAMVTEFLDRVTQQELAEQRGNPHAPQYPETVLSCLHTILDEEWSHLRYAVRDLDAIADGAGSPVQA